MKTDKFFADALMDLMEKNKITKIQLAKKSRISRAYLTQIIVHNVLPSKEVIEKISLAFKIDPTYFKEYRVLEIIENLEKNYWMIIEEDIEEFKKVITKIKSRMVDAERKFDNLTSRREVEFKPEYIISLEDLDNDQIKILKTIVEKYREMNKGKREDLDESYHFYRKFGESPEYDEFELKYGEEEDELARLAYMDEFIEKYRKRLLREKKDEQ
jgi:transcriptional regulator with XRE-family HTH domain